MARGGRRDNAGRKPKPVDPDAPVKAKKPRTPRVKKAPPPVLESLNPVAAEADAPKMGRPSEYTPELATEVCSRIATGETLTAICADAHMPVRTTIYRWTEARDDFRNAYMRAREHQAHAWADDIVDISDDGSRDYRVEKKDGQTERLIPDHDHIARSKLRVEARKWLMSKHAAKTYGDKVGLDVRVGELDTMDDEQLSKHILRLAGALGTQAGFGEGLGREETAH